MRRRQHITVSPADLQSRLNEELLALLPWKNSSRRLSVEVLLHVLWLMVSLEASLQAVVGRFAFGRRGNTVRSGIRRQLPDADELAERFVTRLVRMIPRRPRKGFRIAIDTHWVPYYGSAATAGILRGRAKSSTSKFFVYATAVVVERGQRFTLGLTPVASNRPEEALAPLLDQLKKHHLAIRSLVLDKGFFSARVFTLLNRRHINYIVAVPHHRREIKRFWRGRQHNHATYLMQSRARPRTPAVAVPLCRVRVRRRSKWRWEVYAYGLRRCTAAKCGQQCRQLYRRRFGIEASYRQLNQAKAPTTSRDRVWRLLLIGLALWFRQLWVLLDAATQCQHARTWNPDTALQRLQGLIASVIAALYPLPIALDINPNHWTTSIKNAN
jgi:Transposase DDE domain